MRDIRQSEHYAAYLKTQGWIVEKIDKTNYFLKKIPVLGYILKIQRPDKLNSDSINQLINQYKPFRTILEPDLKTNSQWLIDNNYKLSKSPYLPTKTIHINLKISSKEILKNFNKETRRCIRIGEKVEIKQYFSLKEIEKFHKAWKNSVSFTRFVPSLKSLIKLHKSFSNNHSLLLASHNISGEIIGGAIFTRSLHDYCYYWYGFTGNEGRSTLSQYSLLYQGILWGKRMGCKIFDMEGIYDNRFPNPKWKGFSHFKSGFGGKEVSYPGCFYKNNIKSIIKFLI